MRRSPTELVGRAAPVLAGLIAAASVAGAAPGIERDGTIGSAPAGVVPGGGGYTYLIDDDTMGEYSASGANLFHSFSRFDIHAGESAAFLSNPGTRNIVSRIRSGTASEIAGDIAVLDSGASLFLLNSYGFLFSSEVVLDIAGSFHVSTADGLVFDRGFFDATSGAAPPAGDLVQPIEPVAFRFEGFPGEASGSIVFDSAVIWPGAGSSRVPDRVTFTAGSIADQTAPGSTQPRVLLPLGSVELAAVGSEALDLSLDLASLDARDPGLADLGSIDLGGPEGFQINTLDRSGSSGGRVVIRGGRLALEGGEVLTAGTDSSDLAIDIGVSDSVTLDRGVDSLTASASRPSGPGGIRISADTLAATNGARMRISNNGVGCAGCSVGAVEIDVGALSLDGEGTRIRSASRSTGPGNPILVRAASVDISNGAEIASGTVDRFGAAADRFGGDIGVVADALHLQGGRIVSLSHGPEPGGAILIDSGNVRLSEGGEIRSGFTDVDAMGDPTAPFLSGGDIQVTADSLRIETAGQMVSISGDQAGGEIEIDAGDVRLVDDGEVSTNAVGSGLGGRLSLGADTILVDDSIVGSQARAGGAAGDVSIRADSIQLRGGGQITGSTDSAGRAGDVSAVADFSLLIEGASARGPSGIFARSGLGPGSLATGDGGDLIVRAGDLTIDGGGGIEAQTFGPGTAGAVDIEVAGDLVVADGLISTSSLREGSTNDLVIDVGGDVRLQDGARIESRAPVEAPGTSAGSIRFSAGGSVRVHGASFTTDSARPDSGNVTVEADGLVDVFRSRITTSIDVTDGSGGEGSGDVTLRGAAVVVDKSVVTANAEGLDADAGDISIVAPGGYFQSGDSLVEARSEFGVDGKVVVLGPAVDLAPGLAVLAAGFHDPANELRDVCDARTARVGSFTMRDRLPSLPSPDDPVLRNAAPQPEASDSCELR